MHERRYKPGGDNLSYVTLLTKGDEYISERVAARTDWFRVWARSAQGQRDVEQARHDFERICAEKGAHNAKLSRACAAMRMRACRALRNEPSTFCSHPHQAAWPPVGAVKALR